MRQFPSTYRMITVFHPGLQLDTASSLKSPVSTRAEFNFKQTHSLPQWLRIRRPLNVGRPKHSGLLFQCHHWAMKRRAGKLGPQRPAYADDQGLRHGAKVWEPWTEVAATSLRKHLAFAQSQKKKVNPPRKHPRSQKKKVYTDHNHITTDIIPYQLSS